MRIRSENGLCTLTCKRGQGLQREETEIALEYEQFEALWPLTQGCRIEKTRYNLEQGEFTLSIDVYHHDLEPLMVAEVEFVSIKQSQEFAPPEFCNLDVTQDRRFKNQTLAMKGLPVEMIPNKIGKGSGH